jgi:lipid II:glycine glycyltransferase (peptidoglycan interpeptide bridge formation enzyme)
MTQTTPEQKKFLQSHIQDGGFLQSQEWSGFQECTGKKIFHFEGEDCFANVIEYELLWVGRYWYIPRGPVVNQQSSKNNSQVQDFLQSILTKAKQENIGWIRIEPTDELSMRLWEEIAEVTLKKAAHNVQPKEILVMRIDGSEEEIVSQMKSKTRYNIRLAEKKGVKIFTSNEQEHIDAFCDLVDVTAKRDGITPHPRAYYQKMLQIIPDNMLKVYLAEYEGKIVAANLVVFFGTYATYLHGASGNEYREVMAPYLLQWRQIQDAKKSGCTHYDFGGVKLGDGENNWAGITRFKQGFAPQQQATCFLGSYDVILAKNRYAAYLILQHLKKLYRRVKKLHN